MKHPPKHSRHRRSGRGRIEWLPYPVPIMPGGRTMALGVFTDAPNSAQLFEHWTIEGEQTNNPPGKGDESMDTETVTNQNNRRDQKMSASQKVARSYDTLGELENAYDTWGELEKAYDVYTTLEGE